MPQWKGSDSKGIVCSSGALVWCPATRGDRLLVGRTGLGSGPPSSLRPRVVARARTSSDAQRVAPPTPASVASRGQPATMSSRSTCVRRARGKDARGNDEIASSSQRRLRVPAKRDDELAEPPPRTHPAG